MLCQDQAICTGLRTLPNCTLLFFKPGKCPQISVMSEVLQLECAFRVLKNQAFEKFNRIFTLKKAYFMFQLNVFVSLLWQFFLKAQMNASCDDVIRIFIHKELAQSATLFPVTYSETDRWSWHSLVTDMESNVLLMLCLLLNRRCLGNYEFETTFSLVQQSVPLWVSLVGFG